MVFQFKRDIKTSINPFLSKLFQGVEFSDAQLKYSAKKQFFRYAFKTISFNKIDGDYVEFGCHGGMTFGLAWHEIQRRKIIAKMWAFDSFEGLPESSDIKDKHPQWTKGNMKTSLEQFHFICSGHGIPQDRYEAVAGYYSDTLSQLQKEAPPTNICLAYIDCDMYSSTKSVLEFLMPRLKHGMIIAFDDYFWWSSEQISGERRAMLEFFSNNNQWHLEPYLPYGWASMSFVVENRKLLEIS
ncbi:MAG: TylF/MycF/NovP-related O-methyltransferase [Coleofasciculus chthonoplastes F3-SA18-01]|uniref:TylF/MycF/NovP-related O-methyltransferase n=1 Tax=Coleofasciculus chthonoplastes TaxID=64178 RepID=UPI003303CF69